MDDTLLEFSNWRCPPAAALRPSFMSKKEWMNYFYFQCICKIVQKLIDSIREGKPAKNENATVTTKESEGGGAQNNRVVIQVKTTWDAI